MDATIKWVEDTIFLGESQSGHTIVMDGPPKAGGRNVGIRPMELVLLGMGGCTAFDVVSILKKGRQDVKTCTVQLHATRAANPPHVFTHIHVRYVLTGRRLAPDQVRRAITLSAEKYCSASIMLGRTAEITHDFEVGEPA